jgi:hypothetical protein
MSTALRGFTLVIALIIGMLLIHLRLLDGLPGWTLATFYQDDTQYASGYADKAFRTVRDGMTEEELITLLGAPLGISWVFERTAPERVVVSFGADGKVEHVYPLDNSLRIAIGTEANLLQARMGAPSRKIFAYSRSPHDSSYRVRVVHVAGGRVTGKFHEYYVD